MCWTTHFESLWILEKKKFLHVLTKTCKELSNIRMAAIQKLVTIFWANTRSSKLKVELITYAKKKNLDMITISKSWINKK